MTSPLTKQDFGDGLSTFLHESLDNAFRDILRQELQDFFHPQATPKSLPLGPTATMLFADSDGADANQSVGTERLKLAAGRFLEPPGMKRHSQRNSPRNSIARKRNSAGRIRESIEVESLILPDANSTYMPLALLQEKTDMSLESQPTDETSSYRQKIDPKEMASHMSARKSTRRRPMRIADLTVADIATSPRFGLFSGMMVLLNAVVIGYDTNYRATNHNAEWAPISACEAFFCLFFTMEISMRVTTLGIAEFFCGELVFWNVFDTVVVGCQLVETILTCFVSGMFKQDFTDLRILRILRIIRVVRVVRVVHLFEELRQIVGSMMSSFGVLLWSLVILFILIYLFSVGFLQFILDAGHTTHKKTLDYYFGSLPRTIFTMFESIVGGVNWDDVAQPLITDVSPALAILFVFYIASAMFAIMNMLTGVFVEKAMICVREDKDLKLAHQIKSLFFDEDEDDFEIDWEFFHEKTKTKAMQAYLRELNINASEAEGLFDLLDVDASGSVSSREIVDGCLRLRGPARSLDLALLMREISLIRSELFGIGTQMSRAMGRVA